MTNLSIFFRGRNITPSKEDEQVDENVVEECSKRVTRNQKFREIQEAEMINAEKNFLESQAKVSTELKQPVKVELEPKKETDETYSFRQNVEDDETRMAVESISVAEFNEKKESSGPKDDNSEENKKENDQIVSHIDHTPQEVLTTDKQHTVDTPTENDQGKEELILHTSEQETLNLSKELEVEKQPELKPEDNINQETNIEKSKCDEKSILNSKNETKIEAENSVQNDIKETPKIIDDNESKTEVEEKTDSVPESIPAQKERSPSRDSSEERAKEAALLSRLDIKYLKL